MNLFEQTQQLLEDVKAYPIASAQELEQFRIKFLGTKNVLKDIFAQMKSVPNEQKKEFGQLVNQVKLAAEEKFETAKAQFSTTQKTASNIDLTLPGEHLPIGSRHPVNIVKSQIISIFNRIGFSIALDREMEDDWHNFTALNMPEDHTARDMQDTFYLQVNPAMLLRTHTSSVQTRLMEQQKPPIRIIAPGRV
ncbi:MAG: phenylalanine--tRNA ligase subunit alpha, partial [Bacteroidetes bacterium]|nr:phenylalanine--tRNA ligase subunit alpha [Bacteroidota bacterium]